MGITITDDQIGTIAQDRFDQNRQFVRIVAQIRVEKHHDLNRMDQVLHPCETGGAVPSAGFVDHSRVMRFCHSCGLVV